MPSLNKYLITSCKQEIKIILNKEDDENDLLINAVLEKDAPYIENELVGYLEIKTPSGAIFKYNLYALNTVSKPNFITYLLNMLKQLFI
mgnify:FL=1